MLNFSLILFQNRIQYILNGKSLYLLNKILNTNNKNIMLIMSTGSNLGKYK